MVKNLRTLTFSNIKNEESWFSPFSAKQDSQVDSKLEKIPETIYQVWLYNHNNRQNLCYNSFVIQGDYQFKEATGLANLFWALWCADMLRGLLWSCYKSNPNKCDCVN